jgi:citrate lyase subunit beta/citryl-CoA lyase
MEKAKSLSADAFIFDLEDAVSVDDKAVARERVHAALEGGGYGRREVLVRVNGFDTEWAKDDVAGLAGTAFDALVVPKVESDATLAQVRESLVRAGHPNMPIWPMIETPRGLLRLEEIAGSQHGIGCLIMGTSDLSKELRLPIDDGRIGLLAHLSHAIAIARAFDLDILDGVHLAVRDQASFERVCEQGRRLGFDGKTLIHPSQIDFANQTFGPDSQEAESARAIIEAWEGARAEGRGLVVLDGRLVENLHYDAALRTVSLLDAIAERLG